MRNHLLAAAAALLLAPGFALAQDQGLSEGHLDAADTTDDGALTLAEWQAYVRNAYAVLDVNGDGYVTFVEVTPHLTQAQFDAANTNGDGGLSVQEIDAQAAADFPTIDRDGDGALN